MEFICCIESCIFKKNQKRYSLRWQNGDDRDNDDDDVDDNDCNDEDDDDYDCPPHGSRFKHCDILLEI